MTTQTLKVTQLPNAGVLSGTERVPIVQGGATKQATTQQIADLFSGLGAGTVTSVGLSAPGMFTVAGSPVTTSGTLALALADQNANLVFGGPSSGAAAAPTFRSLVADDMPIIPISKGGTGETGKTAAFDALSPTTTRGDIISRGASFNSRLALGTSGYALMSNGTDPAWTGFVQSGSGAVARTWQAKVGEVTSVKDFGAVGDGVTDDTVAIQAALDAALNIFFPPGTYLVSDTLEVSSGHKITGVMATLAASSAPANTPASVHWSLLLGTVVDDVTVVGLSFDLTGMGTIPAGASTTRAVMFRRSTNIFVSKNIFTTNGGAVSFVGCNTFHFSANNITVTSDLAVPDGQIDIWVEFDLDAYNFHVFDNTIVGGDFARWGILANSLDFSTQFMDVHDFTIHDNVIEGCLFDAIWAGNLTAGDASTVAQTYNGSIHNNVARNVRKVVSLTDGYEISIANNVLTGSTDSTTGIHLWTNWSAAAAPPGCTNCSVVGNLIVGQGTPAGTPIGIWLEKATRTNATANTIRNDGTGFYYYGVVLGTGSEENDVRANTYDELTLEQANFSGVLTNIMSGSSYTPTYAVVANVTGTISAATAFYTVEARRVTVYFTCVLQPTASPTTTQFTITLPVARATNFSTYQLSGQIWGSTGAGYIVGQITEGTTTANVAFVSANTSSARYMGSFTYVLG